MKAPRVVIGLPSHNHAAHAQEAIESILAQTCDELAVVVVDDCSTDGTYEVLQRYAGLDPRVTCQQNEQRVGMIENWRRAFLAARARFPDAPYFAWGSDHDLWHPRWLSVLASTLENHPEVVLAYPLNVKVTAEGGPVDRKPWFFDTFGVKSPRRRLERASWYMSAGNMIYGLFRADAVERAGIFRRALVPDRLLLVELTLDGEFKQVPQILWFRRWYGRIFSLARQRASFFPDGYPAYAYLPWWLNHSGVLAWQLGVVGSQRPGISRALGWVIALRYLQITVLLHTVQSIRGIWLAIVGRIPVRPTVRRITDAFRGAARRLRLGKLPAYTRKFIRSARRKGDEAIVRRPGLVVLNAMRMIPIVKNRVIPWLVRQEIDEMPAGRAVEELRKELAAIAQSDQPVLVGPWISEVGYELLYWIPFLRWVLHDYGIAPARMIGFSRGGAGSWYRDMCDRYVDLFDLITIPEYRRMNDERWREGGNQKQYDVTEFDRELLSLVSKRLRLDRVVLLHPSLMYRLFRYYWFEKSAVSVLKQHTVYRPLSRPGDNVAPADLPAEYVALRFYFRPSFPDNHDNRAFVASLIRNLSRECPVVVLNTGLEVDDHEDCGAPTGSGVYRVDHLMKPENNLAVQSAIIAGARAFVGTYGGLSYLGPFYGVPAVSFYSHPDQLVQTHLDVGTRLSRSMKTPLLTLDVKDAELLRLTLAGINEMAVSAGPRKAHG